MFRRSNPSRSSVSRSRTHFELSLRGFERLEDRRLLTTVPYVGNVNPGQPVAFLVNGYTGGNIPDRVYDFLNDNGAVVHESNWNDILDENGNLTEPGGDPGDFDPTNGTVGAVPFNDDVFRNQMAEAIAAIPMSSPIILIGHSFGGDSVLKVAKEQRDRDIAFLGVLDPVGRNGFRIDTVADTTNGIFGVPGNVGYFFNRFETNAFFIQAPPPFDANTTSGLFFVPAGVASDQASQDVRKDSDGNTIHTCLATLNGECILEGPPLPLSHGGLPDDDWIETQMIDALSANVEFPPVADAGPDQFVDEGTSVTLDGSGSRDANGDIVSYTWTQVSLASAPYLVTISQSDPSSPLATFVPGDDAVGSAKLRLKLLVTDSTGRSDQSFVDVSVANVAPTVDPVSTPGIGVRGHSLRVGTGFDDPGFLDTHQIRWDFGDGTGLPFGPVNDIAGLGLAPFHTYTASGTYTIEATVRDHDGGEGSNTGTVEIRAVALVPRPNNPSIVDLLIGGTLGDDSILVSPGADPGSVTVTINGVSEGTYTPNGNVVIHAQAGADQITITQALGHPVKIFGDDDPDTITLQSSAVVDTEVDGGGGADTLVSPDHNNVWNVTAQNAGTLSGGTSFTSVENLTGGSAQDNFIFASGGISGVVNGGGGKDTLDFSALARQDVTLTALGLIDAFNGTATGSVGGSFANINKIVGSATAINDRLTGLDADATWQLDSTDSYISSRTLEFASFEVLNGGKFRDIFNVISLGVATTLNGNDGDDTFNIGSTANSLDGIQAALVINGNAPSASDTANINDLGETDSHTYEVTSTTIDRSGAATITYGTVELVTVYAGSMGDTFNVQSTLAATPITIDANGGDDVFNVGSMANSLDDIQGRLTLNGNSPSASDVLNVDDQGEADSHTYEITSTTIDRSGAATITYGTVELVTLNAGSNSDTFNIRSTLAATPFTIHGNEGADNFNVGNGANSLDLLLGAVTFTGDGHPDRIQPDVVNINDQGDSDAHTYTITSAFVDRTGAARIAYDTVEKLTLNAGLAGDTVNITDTRYGTPVFANGGGGSDLFNLATGNLDTLASLVTITGGAGAGDQVLLHDAGHAAIVNYAVDRNSVTSKDEHCMDRTFKGLNYDRSVEQLTLEGTQAKNEFVVAPSADTTFSIQGNNPPAGDPDNRDYLEIVFLDTVNRKLTFADRANGVGQWTFGNRKPVNFTGIEKFNYFPIVVSGPDVGGGPHVRVFDADSLSLSTEFLAYNPGFTGGVRVATGDVNNDGIPDIITAAGPGGGPHVRIFDAASGQQLPNYGALGSFFAFAPNGYAPLGVNVATGDFDGDHFDDLVVGGYTVTNASNTPLPGPAPQIRVFSGRDGHEMSAWVAKGTRVAVGDINGDKELDVVVSADASGPPTVQIFKGLSGRLFPSTGGSFFAYNPLFVGGVFVAVADVNGDGRDDIVTGAGSGGGPHVRVFSGLEHTVIKEFFAYNAGFAGGVRVAAADLDGDGLADIITGAGPSGGPHVRVFSGLDLSDLGQQFVYSALFTGGVFVAAHPETSDASECPPALVAADGAVPLAAGTQALDAAQLDLIRAAAIARFQAGPPHVDYTGRLSQIEFRLGNLPGDELLRIRGDLVIVDRYAAGRGWFVDPTPALNEEFTAGGGFFTALSASGAAGHLDLLTGIAHSLGQAMGLDDLHSGVAPASIMADELALGIRRLPTLADVDAVFSEGEF